jgi:urease accessory protein
MLTSTDIRAERVGRTRIGVSADAGGGRCRLRTALSGSEVGAPGLRPMLLDSGPAGARVSLVPDGALLLAGDAVELDIDVGAGTRLDLVEPGGTVAFAMDDRSARWDVRIRLGPGATLTWAGEPFVVAAGAEVDRRTDVRLAPGARCLLRETLVLGRHGEGPGTIRQRTRITREGRPLLVEDLPLDARTAPGLLGGHRVVASVIALGLPTDDADGTLGPDPDRYDLASGDRMWRRLAAQAHRADLSTAWTSALAELATPRR